MLLRIFYRFVLPKVYLREHELVETVFKTQLQNISSKMQVYQYGLRDSSTVLQASQNTKVLNIEGLSRI